MTNFRPTDRQTGFLMPPSIDEWLPQKHLARFVVEVIDGLDLSAMSKSYRGSGSASYHPAVLLGLLVYGCATRACKSVGFITPPMRLPHCRSRGGSRDRDDGRRPRAYR